ncbi:MAG: BON domain-containing protein [Desulfoprunum sp.]|nr:BON domain-containing protein [Desulfoprunum sp.]
MAKFKRILFPLLMVLCACLLASCCTPVGRSAGQVEVVDDATITTQIKTSLLANEALNGLTVFVATVGGEVTLTGAVETGAQIKKASEIAYSVRGVKRVTNLIKLK